MAIDLNNITYRQWNERDLEHPALIDFIKSHPDIKTALDVGAHYSWYEYAQEVKTLIPNYDGVDILPDPKTEAIIDKYWQKNVLDMDGKYDLVFCISSIEHSGISTYKSDNYRAERMRVFQKIVDLSKKYIFITFPFGQEALHEGEFANVTKEDLTNFINMVHPGKYETHFYFSESPFVDKIPYTEVDLEFASNVEYKRELGTRCVCFLSIEL